MKKGIVMGMMLLSGLILATEEKLPGDTSNGTILAIENLNKKEMCGINWDRFKDTRSDKEREIESDNWKTR